MASVWLDLLKRLFGLSTFEQPYQGLAKCVWLFTFERGFKTAKVKILLLQDVTNIRLHVPILTFWPVQEAPYLWRNETNAKLGSFRLSLCIRRIGEYVRLSQEILFSLPPTKVSSSTFRSFLLLHSFPTLVRGFTVKLGRHSCSSTPPNTRDLSLLFF